jgi:hypothetical protein
MDLLDFLKPMMIPIVVGAAYLITFAYEGGFIIILPRRLRPHSLKRIKGGFL